MKVDAALLGDLAALDLVLGSWYASTPKGLAGPWSGRLVGSRSKEGRVDLAAQVDLAKLESGPASLALRANYRPDADRFELSGLDLSTAYGRAIAKGNVDEATKGRKLAEVKGTIEPNWATLGPILAKSAGPGATAKATFRPFHFAGSLAGDSKEKLMAAISGEFGLDLASAQAFGVRVGPASVVLHFGGGLAKFDGIVTKINDGPALIQANLGLDDAGGLWLRLDASRIDGAGDRRPGLRGPHRLHGPGPEPGDRGQRQADRGPGRQGGRAPPDGDRRCPGRRPGRLPGRQVPPRPDGRPGPLADRAGPRRRSPWAQPVHVQVADRKVKTSGMSIPIGGGSTVDFDGTVGFDQSLDCKATIPLTASMLGRGGADVDKLVAGRKVTLPIGGTLSRPSIDRRAFQVALRDTAKSLVGSQAEAEAGRFLDRIAGPGPDGKGGTKGRDAIRGLLEGLGRDAAPAPKTP